MESSLTSYLKCVLQILKILFQETNFFFFLVSYLVHDINRAGVGPEAVMH